MGVSVGCDNFQDNEFGLDGLGRINIKIPTAFTLKEVVFGAISKKLGIPCITETGDRALLFVDGSTPVFHNSFRTIQITRGQLDAIMSSLH